MNEIWRVITKYPDYEVSNWGRVRRCTRTRGTWVGRILKPLLNQDGYSIVELQTPDGRRASMLRVHRLVSDAFIGPLPLGLETNHKDGNKQNNRCENLEYITQAENIKHATLHGLRAKGERNGAAKLTVEGVRVIRSLIEIGAPQNLLAALYGVSTSTLNAIAQRLSWRHV